MGKLSDNLGTSTKQEYQFNGTNFIDVFPIKVNDSGRPTSPNYGDVVLAGKTIRAELWSEGDFQGYEYELNHQYKENGDCGLHCRVFPINDLAGTFEIEFDYIINSIDIATKIISTRSGGTAVMSGTFNAGDYTAGKGVYAIATIDGVALNLKQGEMLQGNVTRNNGTYANDIAVSEIGLHIPVGSTGQKFG
jgi:hypothetical protein